MHIDYYHKNIHSLGEASRNYIEEKLGTLEELTTLDSVRVEIDQQKEQKFHMAVDCHTTDGVYRAEDAADSVNASVDLIEEELKKQIRRTKKKQRDLSLRGARSIKKNTVIDKNARF